MSVSTYISRFFRFVAVVDGRSNLQIRTVLGCSRATVKRFLTYARQSGLKVSFVDSSYKVEDYGPFDVTKLRQMMGRKG